MGERALLLLGLLSLLTAADEVRHTDAQHRATSDPSEGHTVKTGQREAHGLGVADVDGDLAGSGVGAGAILTMKNIVAGLAVKRAEGDVGADLVGRGNLRLKILHLHGRIVIRRGNGEGEGVGLGVGAVGGLDLSHPVGAGIEAGDGDLAVFVGRELHVARQVVVVGNGHELARDDARGGVVLRGDILVLSVRISGLDGEDGARKALLGALIDLVEVELEGEVGDGVLDRQIGRASCRERV